MAQIDSAAYSTKPNAIINSGDRLCFTLFLALALHATFILGIGFEIYQETNRSPVIEVTLAHNPKQEKPEQADYIAQENQIGGGELTEKALPQVTSPTEYIAQEIHEISPPAPPESSSATADEKVIQISTISPSEQQAIKLQQNPVELEFFDEIKEEISLLERSLQLASLDAKLDIREQLKTKHSRTLRVSSVSALKTTDAYYVKQWIKKIHRVGRLNYPDEARQQKIFGDLRLTVSLYSNGKVKDIKVLRSSGHKILDDAAIRIVRLAAPFAPFPKQLKREYDLLEITRTWLFSKDGHTPVL